MDASFLSGVVLLLLVADPLGNIPIFASALREVAPERRRRIILRECLIATGILSTFVFVGQPFMRLLGLSEISLQSGGAVVLMLVAIRMVFPTPEGVYGRAPGGEPFIVPLAVPALAGPSALATVLLLVARDPSHTVQWLGAIVIVMAVSAVVLALADKILARLGDSLSTAMERLMGLILAAIAVEMMLRGIKTFIGGL
ncbi:MAG: MarC family protein [Betaproteobacteria bacterium]